MKTEVVRVNNVTTYSSIMCTCINSVTVLPHLIVYGTGKSWQCAQTGKADNISGKFLHSDLKMSVGPQSLTHRCLLVREMLTVKGVTQFMFIFMCLHCAVAQPLQLDIFRKSTCMHTQLIVPRVIPVQHCRME